MSRPKVSIIIPTYNDATYIERLLKALARQSLSGFEVIVSDAMSGDGIEKVVQSFKNNLEIALVQSPPQGPGAGRNQGAKIAKGEWLLFLDADVDTDDPDFITTLVEEAEAHGWKTASAEVKVKDAKIHERFGNWANYQY